MVTFSPFGCRVFFYTLNPLTAAIRRSGYKLFVKWRLYPAVRLEHYLQNGAVIRGPATMLTAKWFRNSDARLYT